VTAHQPVSNREAREHEDRGIEAGRQIFRYDTFGDEQLWTDVLRMHDVVATVDPATALAVGLKVDVDALPDEIVGALRAGQVDLKDPAVTVALLSLDSIVGVRRTATGKYRTTPLRGLLQHPPYFHDGSAPDLFAVVNHYDALFSLHLTPEQKADLVEYLKSL
jgi:hypothetical protein